MGVDPSATASDVVKSLASRIDLQLSDGWALFEVNPDREHFIKGHDYISDVLSQWERSGKNFSSYVAKFCCIHQNFLMTAHFILFQGQEILNAYDTIYNHG